MKKSLTWINLSAKKFKNNISSNPISKSIKMFHKSLFEILFDLVPHCHNSSNLKFHWFLSRNRRRRWWYRRRWRRAFHQIFTDSCNRELCRFSQPDNSFVSIRNKNRTDQETTILLLKTWWRRRKYWSLYQWRTHEFFC